MLINGHEYKVTYSPMLPMSFIIDPPREATDPVLLVEGIEDITGEYIDFYINSKFICQSAHINNFENLDEIANWFIHTELEG